MECKIAIFLNKPRVIAIKNRKSYCYCDNPESLGYRESLSSSRLLQPEWNICLHIKL